MPHPSPDQINASFEAFGAAVTFWNAYTVHKDRGYAGVRPVVIAFFWAWGLWNISWYSHLQTPWSFYAGLAINSANMAWILAMLRYGRKV